MRAIVAVFVLGGCAATRPAWEGPVQGDIPLQSVVEVVEQKKVAIQSCFQAGIAGGSGIASGWMEARFIIDPEGAVRDLEVKRYDGPASLGYCVEDVLKKTRFPVPQGGAVGVLYPLRWELVEVSQVSGRPGGQDAPSIWKR